MTKTKKERLITLLKEYRKEVAKPTGRVTSVECIDFLLTVLESK